MLQLTKKVGAYLTLTMFVIASTPHDLLHLFTHHHDTAHHHDGVTSIENIHIHCLALQLSLPAFAEEAIVIVSEPQYEIIHFIDSFSSLSLPHFTPATSVRGPPAA